MEIYKTTAEHVEAVENHARSLGLSPYQLCDRAGVAQSTLRRWRRGDFHPSYTALRKLLEYGENGE